MHLSSPSTPRFGAVLLKHVFEPSSLTNDPPHPVYDFTLELSGQDYRDNRDLLTTEAKPDNNEFAIISVHPPEQQNDELAICKGNDTERFDLTQPLPDKAKRALALVRKAVLPVQVFGEEHPSDVLKRIVATQTLLAPFLDGIQQVQAQANEQQANTQQQGDS